VFPFSLVSRYFKVPLLISFLNHQLFNIILFHFYALHKFSHFLLLLMSNFIPLWLEKVLDIISIFLNLSVLVLWANIWSLLCTILLFLKKFLLVYLNCTKRFLCDIPNLNIMHFDYIYLLYILLLFNEIVCICLSGSFGLKHASSAIFLYEFSVWII
jgi:hypothetical protein